METQRKGGGGGGGGGVHKGGGGGGDDDDSAVFSLQTLRALSLKHSEDSHSGFTLMHSAFKFPNRVCCPISHIVQI